MKSRGIPSCSIDLNMGDPAPGKQDAMDLLSDSGFAFHGCSVYCMLHLRLALLSVLNAKLDNFFLLAGLVCSSWVTISSGTHYRAPWFPLGFEKYDFVRIGNELTGRSMDFY